MWREVIYHERRFAPQYGILRACGVPDRISCETVHDAVYRPMPEVMAPSTATMTIDWRRIAQLLRRPE